jgi:hypothetical protein
MNTTVPKYLFISLQLHIFKSGKVAEIGAIPVGVKVLGDRLKNERKWKSVDIGGNRCEKICQMFPRCFPKSTGNGETKYK